MTERDRHRRRGSLYEAGAGFVLRAPLLPVERFASGADGADDPLFELAVKVGSDSLADAMAWAEPEVVPSRKARRLESATLRYLIRCSTRPTPYGMFAGVALGTWGPRTDVRVAPHPRAVRARPDMAWLTAVVLDLEEMLRPQLGLVANTCVFEHQGRLYLTDRSAGGASGGLDVSLRATSVVRHLLETNREPRPYQDLVTEVLEQVPEASVAQARGLVEELWRQDVILTDLRPPMTSDPMEHVIAGLARCEGAGDLLAALTRVRELATRVDTLVGEVPPAGEAVGAPTDAGDKAREAVEAVGAFRQVARKVAADIAARADVVRMAPRTAHGRPTTTTDVLQLDSALPLDAHQVSAQVADDATMAADLLLRLHPAPGGPAHLAAYRAAFLHRYGESRWVPLLQLLDPRFGLGPLASHRAPGPAPHAGGRHRAHPAVQGAAARRQERLWELAIRAGHQASGVAEVVLDEDDLSALSVWTPDPQQLPVSVELSLFLLADCADAVDRGDYRLMVGPNLGAHQAGRSLGRFGDLLSAPAQDLLHDLADREDRLRPGAAAAELTYLPRRHRSANVAVRRSTRHLEIPVGVAPGVPPDHVVPPDELSIGVRGGRLRVRWDRLGSEVVPTASHMLNPAGAPEVVRFLHEVALDGVTTLTPFDWGPAGSVPFLPRVRHGRVVLRPARWRHTRERAVKDLRVDDPVRFPEALARWRERWQVPSHVYLAVGDNRLLLDLDDLDHADLLRQHLRGTQSPELLLHEAMPAPRHAWLSGPGGHYVSELVVPMLRRVPDREEPGDVDGQPAAAPVSRDVREREEAARVRAPGSDWLYVTLAGQRGLQDQLVAGPLRELVTGLPVRSWHFLRYADPGHHLRLRMQGDPDVLATEVLPAVMTAVGGLIAGKQLDHVAMRSYERELERYGGVDAIELAEAIFCADSEAVAAWLSTPSAPHRLPLAAWSVDGMLAGLGLDEDERLAWYTNHAPPPKESSAAHRQHGGALDDLLHGDPAEDLLEVRDRREAALRPVGEELRRLQAENRCSHDVEVLARSFVHMSLNRWGVDPADERVAIGLLRRNAWSRRARSASLESVQALADEAVLLGE